jgi:intracellular sulfur oxidation DsrE/DsrF family protein
MADRAKASEVKILLHAPSAAALERARRNARNARRARPDIEIALMLNGEAVPAALDASDPETDPLLVLCENTLARLGRAAPAGIRTVSVAVIALAEWQQQGWTYVRA